MKFTGKLVIFVLTFVALAASAHAQSPREQLNQMVEQLQKTPSDNALREKIIKLAAGIKPMPIIPPEAKRPFVMAATYQKEAKKPSDFALAIAAYQDALKIVPWWGDAYYNLSVSLESAGRLEEAKDALALYLLTKPSDAEEAQNRLYALDAKKTLAAKQASEAASVLIVPGKSIGPIRLGMKTDEVQRLLGAPDSIGPTGVGLYKRLALNLSSHNGVVTHIFALDDRYSTSEGVKVGITEAATDPKMGAPTTTWGPIFQGSGHGRCYFRDGGATWVWFVDGTNIANVITVVPDCTYR